MEEENEECEECGGHGEGCMCPDCRSGYARRLMHYAKMELLQERIKERMEKRYGKKLDKIADLMLEFVGEKMKKAEELQKMRMELEDAFEDLYE